MKIKKELSIILLIIFLVPMSISTGVSHQAPIPKAQTSGITFQYGTSLTPIDLDPANAWDSGSDAIIQQVCEGLYEDNISDPNNGIIPWLAESMPVISNGGLSYTCNLRNNINFQDGYAFNATAVKMSFDRLINYWIVPKISGFYTLYEPLNNESIINSVVANYNNSVTFNLNYAYAPFLALLTFTGSYIVSPSISGNSYYNTHLLKVGNSSDILVGTGPYTYGGYVASDHASFTRYSNYWGGPDGVYANSNIQTLIFQYLTDVDVKNSALLSGSVQAIDFASANYTTQFNDSSKVVLSRDPSSSFIEYIGMNNLLISQTVRQACNYAFDYNYAINSIFQGCASRMTSPVPSAIIYHDNNLTYPTTNVTKAREILLNDSALNLTSRSDYMWLNDPANTTAWELASENDPILRFNYTYNLDSTQREKMGLLLQTDLADIGISLTITGITGMDYYYYLTDQNGLNLNELNFFPMGWVADFNDPTEFTNDLLSATGIADYTQINDSQLNTWINESIATTSSSERAQLYDQIQQRFVEQLMPWICVSVERDWDAWESGVTGLQPNAMGIVQFGPVSYSSSNSNSLGGINSNTLKDILIFAGIAIAIVVIVIISFNIKNKSKSKQKGRIRQQQEQERIRQQQEQEQIRQQQEQEQIRQQQEQERIRQQQEQERIRQQQRITEDLKSRIEQSSRLIESGKYDEAISELEKIKNEAKPYDIPQISALAEKSLKDAQMFKNLAKMFKVSTKLKIDDICEQLERPRKEMLKIFFEWGEKFGVKIEGDFVSLNNTDNLDSMMTDLLQRSFEDWEGKEKTKEGKI